LILGPASEAREFKRICAPFAFFMPENNCCVLRRLPVIKGLSKVQVCGG
jgi:hypothetical protein